MVRTTTLLALIAALSACAVCVSSCGTPRSAEAAPTPATVRQAGDERHELTITMADGTEHSIEIFGFSHEVTSPRDAASGLPTGRRQHMPFTISRPTDASSPILLGAMLAGDVFQKCEISSFRLEDDGGECRYRVIRMMEPWVGGVGTVARVPNAPTASDEEQLTFNYQRITWSFEDGSVEHTDDWIAAR